MKIQHTWIITGQETSRADVTIREVCEEPGKRCELWIADCAKTSAPLIAAAPELLEACKLALPLLDKLLEASHSIDGIVDSRLNLENDIGDIREAIAKATE